MGLSRKISALWSALTRCQRGATAVEYALIIAMIILVMIAALTSVANKTNGMWNNVATAVTKN